MGWKRPRWPVAAITNRNEIRALPLRSSCPRGGGGGVRDSVPVGANGKPTVRQDQEGEKNI